jgi:hypothetical protein
VQFRSLLRVGDGEAAFSHRLRSIP